ncbi:MAG TPA: glutathione S-transferase family protein [Polyangia bacterium]|nr:glutathione S-transferase family protein [Polyangia bacterium]
MKLVIGNKNYSSWSLRPWLVLAHAQIPFEEKKVSFNDPAFKSHTGPAGKVPVLIDGELVIWDSLAIVEYLAETFPEKHLWPADRAARAVARSICAEFHAGFSALRNDLASNMTAALPGRGWNVRVQKDIDRVCALWRDARTRFARSGGPFLFGDFSIADAYYAPVTRRFVTYAIDLPDDAARYVETIAALPAMKAWLAEAATENDFFVEDEPYRLPP